MNERMDHIVPFAGLAFLWFIGVLRNRMGASEDQFLGGVSRFTSVADVIEHFQSEMIRASI